MPHRKQNIKLQLTLFLVFVSNYFTHSQSVFVNFPEGMTSHGVDLYQHYIYQIILSAFAKTFLFLVKCYFFIILSSILWGSMAQWSELGIWMWKTRVQIPESNYWMDLSSVILGANSPHFVNSQLVCFLPVGILKGIMAGSWRELVIATLNLSKI